ncbi:hypothetical protein DI487_14490 [Flavobacterium sediminis]|uniref:Outer membrane protein beta-barrel domain-containing protein n=1 Tax=Flavobacterium sediminis TaxID=2201181 RepID=A0A2U8QXV5_9FLAO|nr:porin family protein [Flavobacterium sediminis]AWM14938.1 hypothetical protein DI487_14490 [Flavobacterium sediminis]
MRKLLVTGLVLFSAAFYAQKREKGAIELTPKIGYASSNYYSDEDISNSALSSVNIGADADFFFNNRWSIRSGLFYQTMGSKYRGYMGNSVGTIKEKLHYLTVPVNANWHFGSTRKWNLNFGPSFGFLTAAGINDFDVKDQVNSFQLGLNYGIGYKIEVNESFSILIDYQGMTGLTEVPKDAPYTLKNTYSTFNIGAVLKL